MKNDEGKGSPEGKIGLKKNDVDKLNTILIPCVFLSLIQRRGGHPKV